MIFSFLFSKEIRVFLFANKTPETPEIPAAETPAFLSCRTREIFTPPPTAITKFCIVTPSVWRDLKPCFELMYFGSRPSPFSSAVTCGPPPCTITSFCPSFAMSAAREAALFAMLPPILRISIKAPHNG